MGSNNQLNSGPPARPVLAVWLLSTFLALACLGGTLGAVLQVVKTDHIIGRVAWIAVGLVALDFALLVALIPVSEQPQMRRIARRLISLLAPVLLVIDLWDRFLVGIAFAVMVSVLLPTLLLQVIHTLGPNLNLTQKLQAYLAYSMAAIILGYWSKTLGRLGVKWLAHKPDKPLPESESKVRLLLAEPHVVRTALYFVMAIAYILSNVERFAGLTLFPWPWWAVYKDVLLEVLVTFVTIDAVVDIPQKTRSF